MKNLIILTALITFSQVTEAKDCKITLYKKTASQKTSYTLDGESISKRVISKLSGQCEFDFKLFTPSQVKQMKISNLQKRLKKLKEGL